jgi:hypothetical protein
MMLQEKVIKNVGLAASLFSKVRDLLEQRV